MGDWTRDPLAPLTIRLDSVQVDEFEMTFEIAGAGGGPALDEGQVRATMAASPAGWTVAEGTLCSIRPSHTAAIRG